MNCRNILLALVAAVLLAGVAMGALFQYIGWYALLVIPVVLGVLYVIARSALPRLFLIPFQMKGKVLKDATAEVHAVYFLGVEEVEVDEDTKETQYVYFVDLTVKPGGAAKTPFQAWDPNELAPVSPQAKSPLEDDSSDGSFGSVVGVNILENGEWKTEEVENLQGEVRIGLRIRLAEPATACKIRYYFYDITEVALPPITEAT